MIQVITDYPVALESQDHLHPLGTKNDNTTSPEFIGEVESLFKKKINYLDLGCAGGQMAVDFHNRGHLAVGLEGSDYNVRVQRPNWPMYHNTVLFTCDVTKPYKILNDGEVVKFDLITAWELFEHISLQDLDMFLTQIRDNLSDNGVFCATVAIVNCHWQNVEYHPTVMPLENWMPILHKYFEIMPYPFKAVVRPIEVLKGDSFQIMGRKI